MDISTANGTKIIDSALYHVPIIDSKNVKHVIKAHQVSAISEGLTKVDITGVKSMFSSSVQEKWASVAYRISRFAYWIRLFALASY